MKRAILALADGTVFEGRALGFEGDTVGEVVFNTAMTGYQEILTDPSYKGQIITMTCSHIGNYGVNRKDAESGRIWAEGFVVREASHRPSNWRSEQALDEYLREHRVVGIEGIDTRALTVHLRDAGSQQGCISQLDVNPQRAVDKARTAPSIIGRDLATEVTCATAYTWSEGSGVWNPDSPVRGRRYRVVAYDFGIKRNILRRLVDAGCDVTVVPASTGAATVRAMNPDGIFLSNGPGDPEGVPYAAQAIRELVRWRPILGICLGHQLLGLAMGLKTYKLKFGHHGANHPVLDLRSREIEITSQNHNFAVELPEGLDLTSQGRADADTAYGRVAVSHCSLNDASVEGLVSLDHPILSVQYHPEASPGPHDSSYLFQQFTAMMEKQYV